MNTQGLWSTVVVKGRRALLRPGNGRFPSVFCRRAAFPSSILCSPPFDRGGEGTHAPRLPPTRLFCFQDAAHSAADNLAIVQPGADHVAMVSLDGEPNASVLPNTTRAFWKVDDGRSRSR